MNPSETAALGERLEAVRGRLAGAARIAGRKPEDVRLIAVSKLHPVEAILAAYGFGQRVFGENYVQEALAKQEALPDLDVEWHCIGHVQTNKAKDVTGRFALIHTVDNLKFAETLARRLPEDIPVQRVLLQVNIGNEPQKAGVDEHALPALAEAVLALPRLEVRGLMCLPPFFDDGEAARPYFARLRRSLTTAKPPGPISPGSASCATISKPASASSCPNFPWACPATACRPSRKARPSSASGPTFSAPGL